MIHRAPSIKSMKRILLLLVVLFSLAPCTVKAVLFQSFATEYNRPLNKSRTTQVTNNLCEVQVGVSQSVVKDVKIGKIILLPGGKQTLIPFCSVCLNCSLRDDTKQASGNDPPMYILYKRLRFDMA